MKSVSNLTSGVKNFVSNTVSLLRGVPLSHVKSPNAKGVKLSTAGAGSGGCNASGTDGGAGGAAGWGAGAGNGVAGLALEANSSRSSGFGGALGKDGI